jgi:hypothetical protein
MPRRDLRYEATTFLGGVNEDPDGASLEECAVGLNVWGVGGLVETRPGYSGLIALPSATAQTVLLCRLYDGSAGTWTAPAVGGAITLGGAVAEEDIWYAGIAAATFNGFYVSVSSPNTALTWAEGEYWNGSEWKHLRFVEGGAPAFGQHLESATYSAFLFAAPQDWVTTSVNTVTAYWVRFRIKGADLSALTAIDVDNAATGLFSSGNVRGLHVAQYPSTKRYHILALSALTGTRSLIGWSFESDMHEVLPVTLASSGRGLSDDEPSTIAVVPQFSQSFITYSNLVTVWDHRERTGTTAAETMAKVEDRDFAIGLGAPYDKRFLAQLQEFPPCKYITFFKNRLWASGILSEPYTLRWSAPAPYHRVWPSLSYEYLMEDDNSPITGMAPLGEHMVIFKRDSIWLAVGTGENPATGEEHYIPQRVVAGVGCVSNASIKQVRGRLVFLAEDGIYAFDGTPDIKKVTRKGRSNTGLDRLADTVASISKSKRPFCAAAHWRSKRCYLLAIPTSSGANDKVICWEYEDDRWWVWDNIEAQFWLEDEGAADEERLLFGDSQGRIYQMGGQTDDGAAIEAYVKSHRFGLKGNTVQRVRSVAVFGTNKTRELTVGVSAEDATEQTFDMDFTDHNEPDWTDFSYDSGATTDDNWAAARKARKRLDWRVDGEYFQVSLTHNTKYQPMQVSRVEVGTMPLGRR